MAKACSSSGGGGVVGGKRLQQLGVFPGLSEEIGPCPAPFSSFLSVVADQHRCSSLRGGGGSVDTVHGVGEERSPCSSRLDEAAAQHMQSSVLM